LSKKHPHQSRAAKLTNIKNDEATSPLPIRLESEQKLSPNDIVRRKQDKISGQLDTPTVLRFHARLQSSVLVFFGDVMSELN